MVVMQRKGYWWYPFWVRYVFLLYNTVLNHPNLLTIFHWLSVIWKRNLQWQPALLLFDSVSILQLLHGCNNVFLITVNYLLNYIYLTWWSKKQVQKIFSYTEFIGIYLLMIGSGEVHSRNVFKPVFFCMHIIFPVNIPFCSCIIKEDIC